MVWTNKENINSAEEDNGPMMVCRVEDKKLGFKGILVIDSLFKGSCAGGVRMGPDVSEKDIFLLARTMTLKFGFLKIPMGGAKAGISIPPSCTEEGRKRILYTFGQKLRPLIWKNIYLPGEDIGTNSSDVQLIEKGAGFHQNTDKFNSYQGSGYYTGLAAVMAAKAMAQFAGMEISQCSAIIEGFGKVGQGIAQELLREKVCVVGVSTKLGGAYQPEGFNLQSLLEEGATMGDTVIENLHHAKAVSLENLITSEADIIFLCGKPRAITMENVNFIKARIVVGAGNLCFTKGVEEILQNKGIVHLPDFATSCGGVLAGNLRMIGLNHTNIERVIREEYSQKIQRILRHVSRRGKNPTDIIKKMAWENFQRMKVGRPQGKRYQIGSLLQKISEKGLKYGLARFMINHFPFPSFHRRIFQNLLLAYGIESLRLD